ncbi:hypothetical protein K491DRAFT_712280 [Lophiostoma macrostomum CBS 122681]|uniref:Uncharacterized protein n=1 Tax=Lophiostoma macrostomum CBS 122681 TaxID=1314788 RepID=A0A6A6TL95_9PLEO|nr:hypothetical protein K491DRAFT_712280 [Lophiostoma macrostomum CBS 122681]
MAQRNPNQYKSEVKKPLRALPRKRAGDTFSSGEFHTFPIVQCMKIARQTAKNVLSHARTSLRTQLAGLKDLEDMGCVSGPLYGPIYQDIVGYRKQCDTVIKMAQRHIEVVDKRRGQYESAYRQFVAALDGKWEVEGNKVAEKFKREHAAFTARASGVIGKEVPSWEELERREEEVEMERWKAAAEKCIRDISMMGEDKRKGGAA